MASLVVSRRALQLALAGAGVSAALLALYLRWRAARRQQTRCDLAGAVGGLALDYPPSNGCCACACHQAVASMSGAPAAALPAAPASSSRRSRVGGGSRSKRDSIRSGVAGSHRRLRLDEIDDAVPCTDSGGGDGARSGIEALHRVITDLETSLESFDGLGDVRGGAASESELLTELRQLLETAYSIRERAKQRALDVDEAYLPSTDVSDEDGDSDADSFVSALEQLDISDLDDQKRQASDNAHLYRAALLELEHGSVPFRKLRTANLGCSTDTEYLARLHCIRLAMDQLMADRASANWFRVTGRELGALLLDRLGCDVQPFEAAYRDLLQFLDSPDAPDAIRRDLEPRGVRVFGLYDIAFDYMLLDAFEELASPPPSIVSVLQNRWLSAGFKRTALDSTVWTLVLAKRKMLGGARGFSYHFYGLVASLGPALAWGFLGPDQRANRICEALRSTATQFAEDLFSPKQVRFTTVEELAADVLTCAQRSVRLMRDRLAACD
ncbi:hypothetical protein BOX15_Mlig026380g5 [Macrostomum lignano]|uniref:Mitoguardin n=2 Tax=Macrostomum lignano TaxID=282301 RepID=A0A267FWQ7_9PLAT|nr:hypothetical protein BOX15_Mlig026380g5 [Macrostomum lignano]